MRPERPGTMVRDEDVWEFAVFDMEFARSGASEIRYVLHYDESGEIDGYATYRFKPEFDEEPAGEVRVREIWAEDAAAHASLWRYLVDLDLARTVRVRNSPVDEPLRHLVADARAVETRSATTSTSGSSTSRPHSVPVSTPPRSTWSSRSTTRSSRQTGALAAGHRRRRWQVERRGDPGRHQRPTLTMGILELGTIYLGGVPLKDLHRVRRVTEHTDGAVARRLHRLRLAPGAVVPRHVLTTGAGADSLEANP